MAVRIRLSRLGRRGRACYRMGAYDSRSQRDGTCLEVLGTYDPGSPREDQRLVLRVDRVKHWLSAGALPTDKVAVLLKKQGITRGEAAVADGK